MQGWGVNGLGLWGITGRKVAAAIAGRISSAAFRVFLRANTLVVSVQLAPTSHVSGLRVLADSTGADIMLQLNCTAMGAHMRVDTRAVNVRLLAAGG